MTIVERPNGGRRIAIICQLDGYANGVRPVQLHRFLEGRGHQVTLVDTSRLSRASAAPGVGAKLPSLRLGKLALYATEAAAAVLTRRWPIGRRCLSYYALLAEHRLRRAILTSIPAIDGADLVICETPHDVGVLSATSAHTMYDCPTPWADELWFEGRLTERQHRKLRRREAMIFDGVEYLSFHWDSYARYAVEHYGISGENLLTLNFGCTPSPLRARFSESPRVAYLGSLSSRFIDLPLLSRLTTLYPRIDVFGGPPPDPRLGLNYLGYASPDILRQYQIGLITCTGDPLRQNGFSSKHLEYLAYGLPVLVPEWRPNAITLGGSTGYTEATFRSTITMLGNAERWQRISDEAYTQARKLTWDQTLRPLDALLAEPSSRSRQPAPR
ncbi:MAG TPA: hypothetical protein VGR06_26825 [Actinophytocola sp.]|jgi:hypothetical protein|uniref:hypothetical protein n=1 Tax=Actinophytocola sp. TaxID=1872138 RepID=UPI002E03B09F|nr:hypothetical protein [Actinophytocola sp.]